MSAIGEPKRRTTVLLGISRQHLNDIIAARKPITASVAVRVGKAVGIV
jgi:plasmid maintenance system antidote protein VapI